MKKIYLISLILTVFGALNTVINGIGGIDVIKLILGAERSIGSDFLRVLIGLSAISILFWGLNKLKKSKAETKK